MVSKSSSLTRLLSSKEILIKSLNFKFDSTDLGAGRLLLTREKFTADSERKIRFVEDFEAKWC